jgi:hypothetical protein
MSTLAQALCVTTHVEKQKKSKKTKKQKTKNKKTQDKIWVFPKTNPFNLHAKKAFSQPWKYLKRPMQNTLQKTFAPRVSVSTGVRVDPVRRPRPRKGTQPGRIAWHRGALIQSEVQ